MSCFRFAPEEREGYTTRQRGLSGHLKSLQQHFISLPEQVAHSTDAQGRRSMIRSLYDWTLRQAQHPRALWVLAFVAFIESSVFPIPPDVLMIPMILARPSRAWLIASVALVSSVLGGMLGYVIGAFFYDTLGQPILEALGKGDAMAAFNTRFNDLGFWPVLIAGITPFPYKVITIMSGWTGLSLGTFIVTSIIARGIRFFIVAALLWKFGAPIRDFIEKRLGLLFTLFVIILLAGFYGVRFL
jgi:membrane protein YqaA with SNARE-associated domain